MRYIGFIFALCLSIQAIASNTITLSSVSGTPQTEVEVVVLLDNSDAIVALEMVLPLGEHLSYVTNSAVLATARSNGHMISAAQVGQELRIYVYSFSQNALQGNTGELLTFRLQLGNEPTDYALTPTVVLSDAQGTSLAGSVQAGSVTIQAPKLQIVNPQIDYGHIPIRATYTKNLQLKNAGTLPLTIENITTTDPLFVPKQTALTIEAGQTTSVAIEYTPTERGAVSAEMMFTSNATNGEQVATIVADPFSVNELHVGTANGIADSIVTISLTMNNMEPIVAMQCAFKLPKQLEYVANSLAVNTTRANGHQALSTLRGDTLYLAIFSMTNQPLHANDGEIATFQLRLNGSSGTYYLKPIDVVLSNITEENMVSATSQGKVTIKAPSISGNTSLSFGNIPITEVAYATYSVRNNGSAPLVLERATFLAEGYGIVEELPITIANYQTTTITVAYQPTEEGDFSTTMNLYTNDPNNRLKTVALSGHVYEPNTLTLSGQNNQDGTYTISVALDNYTDIVAVQYDLHWRNDMTTSQSAFIPSARMQNHNAVVTPLDEDSYRVIIYSMSNATIAGHNGELHQLVFTPQGEVNYCGSTISVDNIVLSNAAGGDKTSAKSVTLRAEQTQWANDTATACDEYVWNGKTYTESGVYIDTIPSQAGCDSIVTLTLTINRSITTEQTEVACDSYTWTDGKTYTESGTYYQYLQTIHGCDSTVVLHLTINNSVAIPYEVTACDSYTWSNGVTYTQSGVYYDSLKTIHGCDSVEILTLTINYSDTAYFSATACDSYVWHDETYTTSGTYEYLTQTIRGCDSTVVLHLTVNRSIEVPYEVTTCDSYTWSNGITYTQSGVYYDSLKTIHGCDSIEILTLTINYSDTAYFSATACDSYVWHDETYTTSGTYEYLTQTINGCDSLEVLTLTINRSITTEQTEVACDSYTWTDGKTYTESGTYYQYLQTIHGCDSTVVLHLTINNSVVVPYEVTACDSYTWSNGVTYTQSGVYYDSLKTIHGCDSVEILTLTINYSDTAYFSATACDSYVWHDETYTTSGTYEYLTQTVNGCDSLEVLTLTINRSITTEETEVACDTYTWTDGKTYTESGTYYQYLQTIHGCDSTVVLHLTINQTQYAEESVVACDSYVWNGETYTTSGEYTYTTTAKNGCDSIVTLHLTINATKYAEETVVACDSYTWNGETYTQSGEYTYTTTAANGCDSIVTLHLTINATKYAEETVVTCDSYTWNGETYTESGEYTYTTTAKNGCDSIVTLHLTINKSEVGATEYNTICYGETFTWNGRTYTASGEYSVVLTNVNGCDSTATLHLTIMPQAVTTTETIVIGNDEVPYTWRGNTYSATGRYTDVVQYAAVACDSIIHILDLTVLSTGNYDEQSVTICETEAPYIWYGESYAATGKYTYTEKYAGTDIDSVQHILNLTVNPTKYAEETVTACDNYTWNGETYTQSGEYTYTTTAKNGCDSIVTLHLTINATKHAEEHVTACDAYTWNGQTYATTGAYTYTTTASNGCDSIVTLHLTINATKYTEETITACDSYTWNGETYTESGEYTYTTTAANGCDSIVTLHLTINATKYAEESVVACDSYIWNGDTYTTSGEYTYTTTAKNGCDSIVTLHLTINATQYAEESVVACDSYTWNGETYTESGEYTYTTTAKNGCDSIVTLHLTINPTKYAEETVTACDNYTWNGETYTQSGEYTFTTTANNGCDSIITLQLTINNTQYAEVEATACDSYDWNGEVYTQSGEYVYTTTATNGCDSIVTLHLTINKSEVGATEYNTICYGETFTWNGQTYAATGYYSVTLTNAAGCDSTATLHLTIMPQAVTTTETIVIGNDEVPYTWRGNTYLATGRYTDIEQYTQVDCDSAIHVLDLTVLTTGNFDEESITICETEAPYIWYGESYSATGKYTYTEKYAGTDIDSVQHILNLTVNLTQYAEETITACDSYVWNGETYTASGEYTYTTTANNGCDSIITLQLTINNTQYAEVEATACDSYDWNGEVYTQSGEYVYTTTATNGCDSIVTLHLTINKSEREEYTEVACDEYVWHGMTYTESGDYTFNTTTAAGCERIEVLHLTINKSEREEYTEVACDSYEWNGLVYTESGDYTYTTTTADGCERIEVLHLTINNTVYTEEYITACDSYTWNGQTYATTGAYTYTTVAANGCDSIVTLHLTILPDATTESETLALCPSELPYEWYGQSITEAGTYSVAEPYAGMECDSIIHELTLNVYVQTLPAAVTLPIVRMGEAIDVTIPTAEIQAHIAAETWYAPNALVAWYIMENSDWAALTDEPVAAGIEEVTLMYAVETDCGIAESDKMVITVETTGLENIPTDVMSVYKVLRDNKIFIIRDGKTYSILGSVIEE